MGFIFFDSVVLYSMLWRLWICVVVVSTLRSLVIQSVIALETLIRDLLLDFYNVNGRLRN